VSLRGQGAPAAGLALALALGGCAGGPRLRSADLVLELERSGEGRASVTALALDAAGERLLVGDYGGRFFVQDVAAARRDDFADPRPETFEGGVLALGWRDGRWLAVPRRGRGLLSAGAADRSGDEWLLFPTLSGAVVTPSLDVVHWSVLARTLACSGAPSRGVAAASIKEVRIAGVAALADRVVVLNGRAPGPTKLESRALPSLDLHWSVDLGHSASSLALDARAQVAVVADATRLELRALADGALRGALELADAVPHAFGDGERFLLVQGETLSVLHLHGAGEAGGTAADRLSPRVEPAFAAHRGGVGAVAFSADARWLATGGARGDLLLFRIEPLTRPGAASSGAPSP